MKAMALIDEICHVSLLTALLLNLFHPSDGEVKQILLRFRENGVKIGEILDGFKDTHKSVKDLMDKC